MFSIFFLVARFSFSAIPIANGIFATFPQMFHRGLFFAIAVAMHCLVMVTGEDWIAGREGWGALQPRLSYKWELEEEQHFLCLRQGKKMGSVIVIVFSTAVVLALAFPLTIISFHLQNVF